VNRVGNFRFPYLGKFGIPLTARCNKRDRYGREVCAILNRSGNSDQFKR
jgi:hypothetical protein